MYKVPKFSRTKLNVYNAIEAEMLESKIHRLITGGEDVLGSDSRKAPIIYQERSIGVQAGCNIRTDRFEIAIEAKDKMVRSSIAKREESEKKKAEESSKKVGENLGGADTKSSQATSSGSGEGNQAA